MIGLEMVALAARLNLHWAEFEAGKREVTFELLQNSAWVSKGFGEERQMLYRRRRSK